jgi:hypothetical protein
VQKIDKAWGQQLQGKLSLDALSVPKEKPIKTHNYYGLHDVLEDSEKKARTKNASELLNSINDQVIKIKIREGIRAGIKSLFLKKAKTRFKKSVEPLDKSNLIVNADPEIAPRVPLDSHSLSYCTRAEELKQKNLERLEKVAKNLEDQAELEKNIMLEKLKKKKK